MDMILTGRPVDAAEAAAIGLANRVVPAGQALAAGQRLAAELQAALSSEAAAGAARFTAGAGRHGNSAAREPR